MPIVSRAVVKSDWLNISASDTTHDALLDRMIDMVSSEIEGMCNQPIEQKAVTLYFQGNGRQAYTLPYTTGVTLTSLSSRMVPTDSWTNVSGAVIVEGFAGLAYSVYSTGLLSANFYRLIANVGYATVPNDIALCAYEMVKELYYETPFAAEAERFGVSAVSETDSGVALSKAILQMRSRVKPRLERYIVHGV